MDYARHFDFGIILAAGGSTRMGQPKALLIHRGQHLVNAHVHTLQSHCKNIIVVTGRHDAEIRTVLASEILCLHNPDWETSHMSDSLRMAIRTCSGLAVVTPIDCPPAPKVVMDALCAVARPAVCTYRGKDGHPVVIDIEETLRRTGTLRDVLADATRVPTQWPGVLENWNTPNDMGAYCSPDSVD